MGPRHLVNSSTVGVAEDPLGVQLPVHRLRRRRFDPKALRPRGAIRLVAGASTFRARTVSGRERDCLVVEEEERVVMWPPLLVPAASKLERAGDPKIASMKTNDLSALVEDAAVTRPRAAQRDRFDVTERRHAVPSRHQPPLSNRTGSRCPLLTVDQGIRLTRIGRY